MLDWITKLDGNGYESENVMWTPYTMNICILITLKTPVFWCCWTDYTYFMWQLVLRVALAFATLPLFGNRVWRPFKLSSQDNQCTVLGTTGKEIWPILLWNKYFNNCESNDASSLRGWIIQDVKALMIICKYDSKWKTMRELKIQSSVRIFVGPKSDHWLPLSPTHSLYD